MNCRRVIQRRDDEIMNNNADDGSEVESSLS